MAARTTIRRKPAEQGHLGFVVAFEDEEEKPVVPDSITWTLMDRSGEPINDQKEVEVTPAVEITILLKGADLEVPEPGDLIRLLLVEWEYTSTLGEGIPDKHEVQFEIEPLIGVQQPGEEE